MNIAARVAEQAGPGELLVSTGVEELSDDAVKGAQEASLSRQGVPEGHEHLLSGAELMAEGNGRDAEIEPSRGWAVDTLGYVPRLLLGALEDLRTVAESVRVLPEVARSLGAIEESVDSMDREVRLMRQGVDRLDGERLMKVGGRRGRPARREARRPAPNAAPAEPDEHRFGRRDRPATEEEAEAEQGPYRRGPAPGLARSGA